APHPGARSRPPSPRAPPPRAARSSSRSAAPPRWRRGRPAGGAAPAGRPRRAVEPSCWPGGRAARAAPAPRAAPPAGGPPQQPPRVRRPRRRAPPRATPPPRPWRGAGQGTTAPDPTRRGTTPPPAAPPRTRRRAGRRRSRRRPPRPGGRPRPPRPPPWPRPPRSRPLHHPLEQPHRQPGIVVPGVGVRRPGATHLLRVERRLQQRLALLRPPGQDAAIRAHDQRPARERHGALDTRTVGQYHVHTVELGRHPRHALPHVRRGEPATGLASLEHA